MINCNIYSSLPTLKKVIKQRGSVKKSKNNIKIQHKDAGILSAKLCAKTNLKLELINN